MKTLLIIGGTGFFGKSFLDSFRRGQLAPWGITKVIAMARQAEKLRVECPQLVSEQVELLSADIATTNVLPYADIVIHAAASTDAKKYLSHGLEERKNIQAGVSNFCDLVPVYLKSSKLVFVSSGAVYGNQPDDMLTIPEEFSGTSTDLMPENKKDYACAKRDAEQMIVALGKQGVDVSIARCFAFVGPWLPRDQHFAIGNFIGDGLKNAPVSVNARHAVYRSYMHADDLVEWLMTIAVNASSQCPIYNVGSEQAILIGDLARHVARICNTESVIPDIDTTRIDRYVPSTAKAKNELGLTIKIDLNMAIINTINAIHSPV